MSGHHDGTLQRHRYSSDCIRVFSIVATYICNTYYNHLYTVAARMKDNGQANTITDAYRQVACNYYISVRGDKVTKSKFSLLLQELRDYFEKSGYSSLSLRECVDLIASNFIPVDYHSCATNEQKLMLIRRVILSVLADFGKEAVGPQFLTTIIDKRNDATPRQPGGVLAMREKIMDLLILTRNAEFQRHLDVQAGGSAQRVDKTVALKLQATIRSLRGEMEMIEARLITATKAFEQKRVLSLRLIDILKRSQRRCTMLQAGNADLQTQVEELTNVAEQQRVQRQYAQARAAQVVVPLQSMHSAPPQQPLHDTPGRSDLQQAIIQSEQAGDFDFAPQLPPPTVTDPAQLMASIIAQQANMQQQGHVAQPLDDGGLSSEQHESFGSLAGMFGSPADDNGGGLSVGDDDDEFGFGTSSAESDAADANALWAG